MSEQNDTQDDRQIHLEQEAEAARKGDAGHDADIAHSGRRTV